jgi:hypothetical protein
MARPRAPARDDDSRDPPEPAGERPIGSDEPSAPVEVPPDSERPGIGPDVPPGDPSGPDLPASTRGRPQSRATPIAIARILQHDTDWIMPRLRFTLLTTLVLGGPAAPASAADTGRFDGAWSVVATTSTGTCEGPYRYPIVIRDGVIDDAAGNGIDASGRAAADGRVSGTIRQGLASVAVEGRLRGSSGAGRWSLSGVAACTGRWTARRSG